MIWQYDQSVVSCDDAQLLTNNVPFAISVSDWFRGSWMCEESEVKCILYFLVYNYQIHLTEPPYRVVYPVISIILKMNTESQLFENCSIYILME